MHVENRVDSDAEKVQYNSKKKTFAEPYLHNSLSIFTWFFLLSLCFLLLNASPRILESRAPHFFFFLFTQFHVPERYFVHTLKLNPLIFSRANANELENRWRINWLTAAFIRPSLMSIFCVSVYVCGEREREALTSLVHAFYFSNNHAWPSKVKREWKGKPEANPSQTVPFIFMSGIFVFAQMNANRIYISIYIVVRFATKDQQIYSKRILNERRTATQRRNTTKNCVMVKSFFFMYSTYFPHFPLFFGGRCVCAAVIRISA